MELLQQSLLSPDEIAVMNEISNRIGRNAGYNRRRREYYEAHRNVRSLNISVPPSLAGIEVALGWPGMVVDALDERLDVRGLVLGTSGEGEDLHGLQGIFEDNECDITWQEGHIEALIQGVAFETASLGDTSAGEPEALLTVEPATSMSGIWNPRRRGLDDAGAVIRDEDNEVVGMTLFRRDQTIKIDRATSGKWVITDRQFHGIGRPMVRRLVNRSWTSRQWGRSEITRTIIAATDAAMRTLLGVEVAREFYGAPQRVLLGADEKQFKDAAGNPSKAWKAYMGRFLALPRDEDGAVPEIQQLAAASPTPFIDLVKMYAQIVSGEAALPPNYLGFVTENPASADQIRAVEARHVKRAERRQRTFGAAHRGALIDAVMLRDRLTEIPDSLRGLAINWMDAATPTKAAAADAVTKQVQSGVLQPASQIALESLGYTETQIRQIKAENREGQARMALLNRVGETANQARAQDPQVQELAERRE